NPHTQNKLLRREFLIFSGLLALGSLTELTRRLIITKPPIIVTMMYSTEKEEWLKDATDAFNQQHVFSGMRVELTKASGSLDAIEQLLNDNQSRPVVWSPASSLEINLLQTRWQQKYPGRLPIFEFTGDFAPKRPVHSPLVFALWQDRAKVL